MDELALEAKERMSKTLANLLDNYSSLRTGRASPALLDKVQCEYYGDKMPINQISAITSPEPRQLVVKPYDRGDIKAITTAILAADLGLNPQAEADCIRIVIPALTEDTRRSIAKKAKTLAEEAKIATRNIRREYLELLKEDDSYSDDLKKRIEQDIQKVVDEAIKAIENAASTKEKEIMTL